MADRRNKKVVRYRKQVHINVGVMVFFIIFIYLVILCLQFFQSDSISIYEVVKKSISDDNIYEGIILRDETLYYADAAGYVNYYVGNGEKISKGSTIYSIDETGDIYKQLLHADTEHTITSQDTEKIRNTISAFYNTYNDSNYSSVLDFNYDMENTILEQNTENLISSLDKLKEESQSNFDIVKAKKSGIISYTMDGMEDLAKEQITLDSFKDTKDQRKQLRSSDSIQKGSPVYKLINSENWDIIIPLTSSQYKKLLDIDEVMLTFKKDDQTATAGLTVYEQKDDYFGLLSLKEYMVRYLNDRYIKIELKVNKAEGLKIPASSIVKKQFYLVPTKYVTTGGKMNTTGVTKKVEDPETKKTSYEFTPVTICTEEDDFYYIESDDLTKGDCIVDESEREYTLKKTSSLEGVYNVNKGYAVFRVIHKIYQNKEYVIVEENTSYGLSTYDHIVVNADFMEEEQLLK